MCPAVVVRVGGGGREAWRPASVHASQLVVDNNKVLVQFLDTIVSTCLVVAVVVLSAS